MTKHISAIIKEGVGKKSGKPYQAVEVTIGTYKKFIFPTEFEMRYLVDYLTAPQTSEEVYAQATATPLAPADNLFNNQSLSGN